ncbi:hypothetical protein [Actinomadura parmotrematis]|uniref:Uncharacterized protein n=1 Tax=Actinomadura parmotrematis TaxID=2864039 RepID=A0ABS7FPD7_9ACTN|nr:hypothetical protein [Actinomadura parmotrematis]MBW8482255.1 hypothetical protein [Actinomadura parmotrematis]
MPLGKPAHTSPAPNRPPLISAAHRQLAGLAVRLGARRMEIDHNPTGLVVRNPQAAGCCPENRVLSDTIVCRPFERDGNHLWFFTAANDPIIEADRLDDAAIRIAARLTPRSAATQPERRARR